MTGRRKGGRKIGSASKKETPEKARRSSRRRGQKKSESEDSGSERSVDEQEESAVDPPRKEGNEANKEDESGGSDGSWQVRSENGNKGGIPKLKISLHRPAETSSPTPEPLSSPRPRRTRRGATSPSSTKNEDASEDGEDSVVREKEASETSENEGDRNPSKCSRKQKEISHVTNDTKSQHESEKQTEEEKKLRTEAEEKSIEEKLRKEEKAKKFAKEETEAKRKAEEELEAEKKALAEERARRKSLEEKEAKRKADEKEKARQKSSQREAELKEKMIAQAKKEEEEKETKRKAEREARKRAQEERERKELAERDAKRKIEEEAACRSILQEPVELQLVDDNIFPTETEPDIPREELVPMNSAEDKQEVDEGGKRESREVRSPSRDSSEERAKQAALASRKPKRREGSEDGELVDSPETEIIFPVRTEGRIRTTAVNVANEETKENNENTAVVRKRRWGTSNSQSAKKPQLVISTDVLKEIIPEVRSDGLEDVELSPLKEPLEEEEKPSGVRRISSSREEAVQDSERDRLGSGSNRRRRSVPSDESEKDYEEEGVESGGEEMVRKEPPTANHNVEHEDNAQNSIEVKDPPLRKMTPRAPLESLTKQRSPSPARNPVSNILFISNLVRPFTVVQLRDLLARTGTIVADTGFWIDAIKSKCYVKYTSEEDAKITRHALHGVRWPASNPKQLDVDFGNEAAMKLALEGGRPVVGDAERRAVLEQRRERESERELREKERKLGRDERKREVEVKRGMVADKEIEGRQVKRIVEQDRDRGRDRELEREKARTRQVEPSRDEKPTRTVRKVTIPVREWDLGKAERGFSPPPPENNRYANDREERRKREKERDRSNSLEPYKKVGRKEEPPAPPKMLLDDLFRKTKAAPCIYWLPLSDHQIAEKEAQRRKHMEEHEKRLSDERKRREVKRRRSRTRSRSPHK